MIAFAVDFATGTIFLPERGVATNPADEHPALVSLSIPPDQLSFIAIEKVVSDYTQQPIRLQDGKYEIHTLEDIEAFWSKHEELQRDQV